MTVLLLGSSSKLPRITSICLATTDRNLDSTQSLTSFIDRLRGHPSSMIDS